MSDDWWTQLVYEDRTPVAQLRANHMSKLHISTARHLWKDHRGEPVAEQVPLPRMTELHNALHTPDELKSHHVCAAVADCASRPIFTAHPHAASR